MILTPSVANLHDVATQMTLMSLRRKRFVVCPVSSHFGHRGFCCLAGIRRRFNTLTGEAWDETRVRF